MKASVTLPSRACALPRLFSLSRSPSFLPLSSLASFPSSSARSFASSSSANNHKQQRDESTSTSSFASPGLPPKPARSPSFAALTDNDLSFFRSVVDEPGILTDAHSLEPLNEDWLRKYRGSSKLALRPTTTAQVSAILRYCSQRGLAVVPQGGNTGLVGGSVPVHDEIILSLTRMNKVVGLDEVSGILTCQAGCVLEVLDQFLEGKGFIMPLDLGAKGSCQIGGNVATNAGGVRYLRYGSLKGNVLGLEVVLPDGTIINTLNGMRKDNTGYDLKQLFIGSEGSLGVITGVSILTPTRPKSMNVALVAVKSFDAVQTAFTKAKADLGEILSAFEFWDRQSLDLELEQLSHIKDPLSDKYPFYVLIETSGSHAGHDLEKLERFLESSMTSSLVQDGTIAQSRTEYKSIWKLRESITEALSKAGAVYKYDLSLPIGGMYNLVEATRKRVGNKGRVVGYGHVGDSNLHLNVSTPRYSDEVLSLIEPFVYDWTARQGGSISAEHGLGLMKRNHIHYSKSAEDVKYMQAIKRLFDPTGIMNPYKVLPDHL
ncbi:D-2-hydroxyglutarate dehydrogenase, mitochondrial [Balamuthia mandrillaris]